MDPFGVSESNSRFILKRNFTTGLILYIDILVASKALFQNNRRIYTVKKNSNQSSFNGRPKSFIILSHTYCVLYCVALFKKLLYINR